MGRRSRRRGPGRQLPPPPAPAADRVEEWPDGDWVVRTIAGAAATKAYRCPGCNQEVRPGTPHLVTWAQHLGSDTRRHWHTACWRNRARRR
ncbi:MAG: hypothetical protein GEV07_22460 [Streptosporangiales bacterium]|nr:hypothetical protein [Streptosporangiales bacterium]